MKEQEEIGSTGMAVQAEVLDSISGTAEPVVVEPPKLKVNEKKGFRVYYSLGLFNSSKESPKRIRPGLVKYRNFKASELPYYELSSDSVEGLRQEFHKSIDKFFDQVAIRL